MWFIGIIAGLFIGALFESVPVALVLAVAGAFLLPRLLGKKKVPPHRTEAERIPGQAPADPVAADGGMVKLQRRVMELEQRVVMLERRLTQGAGDSAVQASELPAVPEVALAEVPLPPAQPLEVQRPQVAVVQVPGPEAATAPAAPEAPISKPPVPAPAPLRRPPPPPPVPLRDRLPAPIANLIFGGNMLVKLGVLILFLGLAFLLRYTAERVTVPIELRYAAVALVGAGLLVLGWLLRNKRAGYALILQGAGIGVFYLTTLAAMKLSGLLPASVGFAFLFGVAVLSAALAVLQNAPVLAIVAALEGFAAPVLASTGSNQPVGLFTYLLVLDVGIVLIAWFRAWRVLNLIGFVGTFTLAAGWAHKYYTDDQYATVQPFLIVFFLLFTAIGLLFARRTLFDAPVQPAQRLATRARHVAGRLAYGHCRALPGIEEHVAAVAVGGHRERPPRAFDAKDGGVGAGQHQGIDPDLLIVLAERPFLGRDRRRREQLGQSRAIVSRLRQGQRIEGAALGQPRRLGRGLAVFGCFGQQIDRHLRHDLALEPRGQLGALGHRADLDRVELPFREHAPHFLLAAARGDEQHALLRLGQ